MEALKSGSSGKELAEEIKRKINATQKYASEYDTYTNLVNGFSVRYTNILDVNDQVHQYAKTEIQQTIRHSLAEEPDKKAKPKRAIIVLLATFSAFIMAIFILLGIEKVKELRAIN